MRALQTSRITLLVLAFLLLFPAIASAQSASPTPSISYDQAKQTLDRFLTEAERIAGQLDASQYDLDALPAKLGVNANEIVGYVRDNIAFEQYRGLLRGAKWTLIGRAGNSIDQAVLLATLLSKAGYQIKIQHGALNPQQASMLLAQMAAPRKPAPPVGNLDAIKTLVKQMARTAGVPDAELQPYLASLGQPAALPANDIAATDADAASITSIVSSAGVKLGDSSSAANLAAEASDYFWVSYRKSIDDKWIDAHPAFKSVAAPTLTPAETFDGIDAIPAADKQTISIEPILERSVDGVISQKSLAPPLQGPADQLAGQPFFFTTLSNAAAVVDDPKTNINTVLAQANLFAVQFNTHSIDNTTVVFDDHGTLFNLKQLKPGEFGLTPQTGEVISASLSDAVAALNDEPTPTPGPTPKLELTGLWLNFTFAAPGGGAVTVRRTIVDRIGQSNRDAGLTTIANPNDRVDVAAELAQNVSMYASVGQMSVAYLTGQFLNRVATTAPLLRLQLRAKYFPNEEQSVTNDQRDAIGTAWAGFAPLVTTFDAIATADPKVVSYRPAPLFVTYRQELVTSKGVADQRALQLSVDVVANPRRAYSVANGSLALAPDSSVRAGVWETHSEKTSDVDAGKATTFNTMSVMAAAKSQSIATRLVQSEADLAGIDLTPEGRDYLKQDLAAGYVAIVPVKTPNGQPLNGWWRIDPKTGATLGMLANGRGAAMSETGMLIRAIACAAGFAFAGQGAISMLIGCGFAIGGAALGYAGASALVGEIVSVIGLILGVLASVYGV